LLPYAVALGVEKAWSNHFETAPPACAAPTARAQLANDAIERFNGVGCIDHTPDFWRVIKFGQ